MNSIRSFLTISVVVALLLPISMGIVASYADADTTVDSSTDGFISYYDQLDDNEKAVYDALQNFDANVLTVTVTLPYPIYISVGSSLKDTETYLYGVVDGFLDDAFYVLQLSDPLAICTWGDSKLTYDHDYLTSGDTIGYTTVEITAHIDPAYADDVDTTDVNELQKKIDAVNDALDSFTTSGTTRDKVGSINKYVLDTAIYDPNAGTDKESPYAHDIYGVLVASDHYAVCNGYSKTILALCEKYDIDCIMIYGYAVPSMEAHAWNYIKMDNGSWYALDSTWNDAASNAYFLVGIDTFMAEHQAGLQPSTGATLALDYPVLADTKYDADPWYDADIYPMIVAAAIVIIIIGIVIYTIRKENKKAQL